MLTLADKGGGGSGLLYFWLANFVNSPLPGLLQVLVCLNSHVFLRIILSSKIVNNNK